MLCQTVKLCTFLNIEKHIGDASFKKYGVRLFAFVIY